jgi:hypothetical protein
MDISQKFNRFAGREVNVTETVLRFTAKEHGVNFTYAFVDFVGNDPAIADLIEAANKEGLSVLMWLPGWVSVPDIREDRLNAYVAKEKDGKYRIQPRFLIG